MMKEIIFHGDDVLVYDFPSEVDIIYPPEPLKPNLSAREIVSKALDEAEETLEEIVGKDSEVVIAFDDVSVPLPLPRNDPRKIMAEEVLKRLKNAGIDKNNILFICATGMHRKCSRSELKSMLGDIAVSYKTINHDCREVVSLGETESGYKVEINEYAADADVLIYLSLPFLPMNGGWKSIAVGLGSYECIRQHHIPEVLIQGSYMNPSSEMHGVIEEIGKHVAEHVRIFQVEVVVDNSFFSGFVSKSWEKIRGKEKLDQKLMLRFSNLMPAVVKSAVRRWYRAGYEVAYAAAGDVEKVHQKALEKIDEHRGVEIKEKYDALIFGLPNMSPYNVGSELNPVLFHTLVRGYLCNMFEKILAKNAAFIVQNPVTEVFDEKQHPAYKKFYYEYLARGKVTLEELERAEEELIEDSRLMEAYAENLAYHPAHAVIAYYWGSLGFKRLKKMIVAGSSSRALKPLGFDSAKDLKEAIRILKEIGLSKIAYVSLPPVFFAK
jgi:hypothetical protein